MWPFRAARAVMRAICCITLMLVQVRGSGRLWDPPSRSSMWRRGYQNQPNYDDSQLNCGGFVVQYQQNNGKCGVCGDPFTGPQDNDVGGKYALGLLVRKYDVGDLIDVTIELTANLHGYFEFNLCNVIRASQSCFQQYPLIVASTKTTRYKVAPNDLSFLTIKVKLPGRLDCRACVFRWKYTAGNNWGLLPNGTGCLGCGHQEEYYGCADIVIGHNDVVLAQPSKDGKPLPYGGYTQIYPGLIRKTTVLCRATTFAFQNSVWTITIIYALASLLL